MNDRDVRVNSLRQVVTLVAGLLAGLQTGLHPPRLRIGLAIAVTRGQLGRGPRVRGESSEQHGHRRTHLLDQRRRYFNQRDLLNDPIGLLFDQCAQGDSLQEQRFG